MKYGIILSIVLVVILITALLIYSKKPVGPEELGVWDSIKKLFSGSKSKIKTEEEMLLEGFLKENLLEKYIPSKLNVVNRLIYEGGTSGVANLYGATWFVDGIKFYTNLHYNTQDEDISNMQIFVFIDRIIGGLDEIQATLLFDKYFKVKYGDQIKCTSPVQNINYCETFWTTRDGNKKGLVAVNTPTNNFVAMCEYPEGSEEYGLSSCVRMQT